MEVVQLIYNASGPSFVASVDKVNPVYRSDGQVIMVPVMGERLPERHITMQQLATIDAQLASDFFSVLARLEPIVRGKAALDVTDPDRMREEANRIARERARLEEEARAAAAAVDLANVETLRIQNEHTAALAELDGLTSSLTSMRDAHASAHAELARLSAEIEAKRVAAAEAAKVALSPSSTEITSESSEA